MKTLIAITTVIGAFIAGYSFAIYVPDEKIAFVDVAKYLVHSEIE